MTGSLLRADAVLAKSGIFVQWRQEEREIPGRRIVTMKGPKNGRER